MDLCATPLNAKTKEFVSPLLSAELQYCMSVPWDQWFLLYAYPPSECFPGFLSRSSSDAPSVSNNHISLVAHEGMVPITYVPDPPKFQSPSSPPLTGSAMDDSVSPHPSDFKLACGALIRSELEHLHWSSPAISVIDQLLCPQSSSVYDRYWEEFTYFAKDSVSSLSEVSLATLTGFLLHLALERKLQISTFKAYVSAIKLTLKLVPKRDITAYRSYDKFM